MEQQEPFLTAERVEEAYRREEAFANDILYDMCRKAPDHQNTKIVEDKIFVIGRVYAAPLERNRGNIETSVLYTSVATRLKNSELDKRIEQLHQFQSIERDDTEVIKCVLAAHWLFVDAVKQDTQNHRTSLASKYLHFHVPQAFFIYDSLAWAKLASIHKQVPSLRQNRIRFSESPHEKYDDYYKDFFLRMLNLRGYIEETFGYKLTPRMIDNLLLSVK